MSLFRSITWNKFLGSWNFYLEFLYLEINYSSNNVAGVACHTCYGIVFIKNKDVRTCFLDSVTRQ